MCIYCEGNEVYLQVLNFICDAEYNDSLEVVCWNGNLLYTPKAWQRGALSFDIHGESYHELN